MSTADPASDARDIFGGHLYRMLNPENKNFIVSPASIQKLLLVAVLGANANLSDEMLWDLEVKHLDIERLRRESVRRPTVDLGSIGLMVTQLEHEQSVPIKREKLIEFFQNDFNELGIKVNFENFIAANSKFQFKKEFLEFAKNFFNVALVHKDSAMEVRQIDQLFPGILKENKKLEIFSSVVLKLRFKPPFEWTDQEVFEAYGTFKFKSLNLRASGEFFTDILEIPLDSEAQTPLTMLIFIPNYFRRLISQAIGREIRNFNEISNGLQERQVKVTLPKLNLQLKTDLTEFFCDNYVRGVGTFFNEQVVLDRMFKQNEEIEVGCFWQNIKLEIDEPENAEGSMEQNFDIDFNAIGKSFFYVIKSSKVLYVMGQYWQES